LSLAAPFSPTVQAATPAAPVKASAAVAVPVAPAFTPVVAAPVTAAAVLEPEPGFEAELQGELDDEMAPLDAYAAPEPPVSASPETPVSAVAAPGAGVEMQRLAVDALLEAKGQTTAADAIADASWSVAGDTVTIQTEVSKIMLPTVVNAEAEKLVRGAVVRHTPGLKVVVLPGVKTAASAEKKPRAAKSGAAQAKALEHPIVQEAQRLFRAEIRNVIDLRADD